MIVSSKPFYLSVLFLITDKNETNPKNLQKRWKK